MERDRPLNCMELAARRLSPIAAPRRWRRTAS